MDANSEGQSSLLLGMIVGAVIFLSSAIFFALNVMAIIAMLRKRESSRSSAYKMMILLSISNCLQMLSQGVSGLFAMSLSEWHPLFNKVLGASLEASYDVYSVFTAILALDRLLRIACPNIEQCVFSASAMKVWYSIAGLIFLVIFFLLASPIITLTFRIGEFFWGYAYLYENSPVSRIYRTVAELIVVGPFVVAALLHFVIFIVVTYKRKVIGFKFSRAEKKVLTQAAIIAAYDVGSSALWMSKVLPEAAWATILLDILWVFSGSINPIVYFSLNPAELVALIRSVKRDIWPTRTPPSGVQPWKNVNGSSLTR